MLRRPITYYAVGAIVVVIVIEAKGVRPPKPYINYNLVLPFGFEGADAGHSSTLTRVEHIANRYLSAKQITISYTLRRQLMRGSERHASSS